MTGPIVEIRDYTIEAEWLDPYRRWAEELAAPWLKANLNVIDFWMDCGIAAEVGGTNPQGSPIGQPNVCWVIRWPSKEERDEGFAAIGKSSEWQAIWAKHPNENAYLQMNARFMEALG